MQLVAMAMALAGSLAATPALAQFAPESPSEADTARLELAGPVVWPLSPALDRAPGWSIGLDAYAGLAVLSTRDGALSHAVFGGLSRFQWQYFQAGGLIEVSDPGEGQWRSIGGFVGAFVPFRHWVDFEFAGGLAARTYRDTSLRYGPDGYEATTPALTLRAGFSDRSSNELFGMRLGGHLAAAFDLTRHERPWTYDFESTTGETRSLQGQTRVGGFSLGLAVTAGFDIGRKGRRTQ